MLTPALSPRLPAALVAGAACAVLVACGSSNNGLIPLSDAGPLQSDFETVAEAAQSANGNCKLTEVALEKTERDFSKLPSTVDGALHRRLEEGIKNLRRQALVKCAQSATTKTETSTVHTSTTPTTTTTETETEENGGTPPPEESEETETGNGNGGGAPPEHGPGPGPGKGNGNGNGDGGSPTGGQEPG